MVEQQTFEACSVFREFRTSRQTFVADFSHTYEIPNRTEDEWKAMLPHQKWAQNWRYPVKI